MTRRDIPNRSSGYREQKDGREDLTDMQKSLYFKMYYKIIIERNRPCISRFLISSHFQRPFWLYCPAGRVFT